MSTCREGVPIEHSIVRAGFTVASVGTVLLDVLIGGVVAVALIQTLSGLPEVVTCVVVEECSEVFPAICRASLAADRRDTGRDILGREKVLDFAVDIC